MCTPPGKGPFPAAILVHGGGWIGGDRTQAARALVRPLTQAGIAWLAVSYRLAPRHRYPAPVEDVARRRPLDAEERAAASHSTPQRLALVGESAGGHLVADAAVRATRRRAGRGGRAVLRARSTSSRTPTAAAA